MALYLISLIFLLIKLPIFSQGCQILTDQHDFPVLQCDFPENVTIVTWRGTEIALTVTLSTCSFENDTCSNYLSRIYAVTDITNGTRQTRLVVESMTNHTVKIECIPDNGLTDPPCELQMYAWPKTPVCVANVTNTYVEITCTTDYVYPALNAVLYRREENLTTEDYVAGYPKCILSERSFGLYDGTCTWRIPMERMLEVSTFYVEMTANVSNASAVGREPSTSNNITVTLEAPQVVVYRRNCPLGPGAIEQSVLIGANATCKCELTSLKYPARARWYTTNNRTVGDEDKLDRSSTITFSYISSDPNQAYVCRLVSPVPTNVSEVPYTPTFTTQNCTQAIEKSPWQFITSNLAKNVTSITWQLISGVTHINLSTCNVSRDSKCSDTTHNLYSAYISSDLKTTTLALFDPRLNETQFAYVTDAGQRIDVCPIGLFVPADKPTCDQRLSEDYVEYTCTTEKVYPRAEARLVRNKVYLTEDDFVPGYPRCVLGDRSDGNFNQTCVWRIPMTKMIPFSQISVVMRSMLKNQSVRTESFPQQSDVVLTSLSVPYVTINKDNCPHGLWVRGDTIPIDATATCECDLMYAGFPSASASWYDKHNKSVGVYYENLFQATLTVSYNSSDPNPSYECRPITPLRAQVNSVRYTPKFSSAPRNSAFELLSLIVILGAVWTGV